MKITIFYTTKKYHAGQNAFQLHGILAKNTRKDILVQSHPG